MAKNTRELIIRALITLAKKNPQRSSFTMTEIAAEAGISRQAIYQKHFNNFEDIIEYIHEETNQHIFNVFNKFCPSNDGDPISFLADHILPLIYEKRKLLTPCIPHKSTHVGRNFFVEHTLNGSSRMSITN